MIGRHKDPARLRLSFVLLILVLGSSVNLGAQHRMPPIPADKMTDAQKNAAAEFAAVRKTDPTGPFAVMLRVPELMTLAFKWREHVQFRSVLDQRLTELAIIIAARHWTQEYEWNAHYPLALKAGLKPEIIAAVEEGRRPSRMAEDEEILYDFCTELQRNHGVSDATYARALAKFGEAGIVEAASLEGYYSLLAMVMNTARTPLPAGARPPLAAFPH
jgi:4-carboxymuconolactone decarboxylase